jgi:hypothetical protein
MAPESQRTLLARLGAHAMHAQHDAFMAGFEDKVDPERVLPEAERKRRAAHARKAYFTKLALKSAKARRLRKAGAG